MLVLIEDFKLFLLYVLFLPIFGLAALEKFSRPVPDWFIKQFESTVLNYGPVGLTLPYYGIATLEALTTVLFLVSLLRGEFRIKKEKKYLKLALVLAMTTFCVLGFGLRLSHDFNGGFQIFGYFILTFLLLDKLQIP